MNIGNLSSAIAARTPLVSSTVSDVTDVDGLESPPPPPEDESSSRVSVSKGSELMQQLSTLQKTDPAKFQLVVDQISEKFGQLASSKTGAEQDGLSRLSQALKKVADTGDLTALRPDNNRSLRPQQVEGEGGQGLRVAEMYRRNGPPPAARQSIDDAFTQALTMVGAATGAQAPASNTLSSDSLAFQQTALSGVQAA
jgi:hypothetical protein